MPKSSFSPILATLYIFKGRLSACTLFIVAGFFYAYTSLATPVASDYMICGSVPPCVSVMDILPLKKCIATGKAGPFFFSSPHKNFCKMLYTEQSPAELQSAISQFFYYNSISASKDELSLCFVTALGSDVALSWSPEQRSNIAFLHRHLITLLDTLNQHVPQSNSKAV